MKTIVAIFFVFTLFKGLNGYSQGRVSERQLMNLGIAITDNDMSKLMSYKSAKLACQKLGKQWRLPTHDEFNSAVNEYGMNELKEKFYWSSDYGGSHYIAEEFPGQFNGAKYSLTEKLIVRCVRRLRPSEMGE